ncbi:hypothetical protein OIU77_002706 [Salix suchowensis]|uniref:Uncharacterized protein n=1 Tax=Salix suchowensis TaxID=1278906 RepID=A0ABQ9AX46_9ROSI|nr:hypothetical protein OIU77_002706 [Salix suchowensis]
MTIKKLKSMAIYKATRLMEAIEDPESQENQPQILFIESPLTSTPLTNHIIIAESVFHFIFQIIQAVSR